MAYATGSDIAILYGEAVLDVVASRDDSGRQSEDAVLAALESSSAEIDTYLGMRYVVPLETPPPYIKQVCVDITVYRLALDIGPRTEEMRLRYKDAIDYLKMVSKGEIDLPVTSGGSGGSTPGSSNGVGTGARVLGSVRG